MCNGRILHPFHVCQIADVTQAVNFVIRHLMMVFEDGRHSSFVWLGEMPSRR
jgi:hypothetical protein